VRNTLLFGDIAADAVSFVPLIIQEAVGLKAEIQSRKAGTCPTAFGK
jgi:hypothetical protein